MNKFLLLLTSLYVTTFFSQITNSSWIRYENYVDTLSSNYFKGRGYVDNGHLKAAKFISNEFQRIGLDSITSSGYLQHFKTNVNTFPTEIKLKINDDSLIPGLDYLIEPGSVSCQGIFEVLEINLSNWKSFSLNKKNEDLCLLIDVSNVGNKDSLLIYNEIKKILNKKYPILWIGSEKLQWSVSQYTLSNAIIKLRPEIIKEEIKIVEIDVKNYFITSLETQNVIGKIKGRKKKDIIISAHYDHLGMMGNVIFPGANDNASGVSLLLNLASFFIKNKLKYNIIFNCFGAEELGLLGSKYFTENPLIELENIKLLLNLDIVGTGEEGIAIVNAFEQEKVAQIIGKINEKHDLFSKIKLRGQAPNSDHYWFSKINVPEIFIYTMGGIKSYHDPLDKSVTLPQNKSNELLKLVTQLVNKL